MGTQASRRTVQVCTSKAIPRHRGDRAIVFNAFAVKEESGWGKSYKRHGKPDPFSDYHDVVLVPVCWRKPDPGQLIQQVLLCDAKDAGAHPTRKRKAHEASVSNAHPDRMALDSDETHARTLPIRWVSARTPLWDKFLEKLELATASEHGRELMKFIEGEWNVLNIINEYQYASLIIPSIFCFYAVFHGFGSYPNCI